MNGQLYLVPHPYGILASRSPDCSSQYVKFDPASGYFRFASRSANLDYSAAYQFSKVPGNLLGSSGVTHFSSKNVLTGRSRRFCILKLVPEHFVELSFTLS